jgi:hypothetical protein
MSVRPTIGPNGAGLVVADAVDLRTRSWQPKRRSL